MNLLFPHLHSEGQNQICKREIEHILIMVLHFIYDFVFRRRLGNSFKRILSEMLQIRCRCKNNLSRAIISLMLDGTVFHKSQRPATTHVCSNTFFNQGKK